MINFVISLLMLFLLPFASVVLVYLVFYIVREKYRHSDNIMAILAPILTILLTIYFLALSESYVLYLLDYFNFSFSYILKWLTVPAYVFFIFDLERKFQNFNVIKSEDLQINAMSHFYSNEEILKPILDKNRKPVLIIASLYAFVATLFFSVVFFWEGLQKYLLFFV
jgi:hypothetical protein